MAAAIKSVGVIGTGVIGASWTGLFLSRGLKVLVSDPAPGAEKALTSYLESIWPTLKEVGLSPGASLSNYTFVGASLEKHYGEVDFIQEVSSEVLILTNAGSRLTLTLLECSRETGVEDQALWRDRRRCSTRSDHRLFFFRDAKLAVYHKLQEESRPRSDRPSFQPAASHATCGSRATLWNRPGFNSAST